MEEDEGKLSLKECDELFARLFPQGPAGADVLGELAPEGWEKCELLAVAHPNVERLFEEATRMHENLNRLKGIFGKRRGHDTEQEDVTDVDKPPTFEEIARDFKPSPVNPTIECAEIVGHCLWHIFSDNHEVLAPDGRVADTGSFRGTGGFIADWMNRSLEGVAYDYVDFYMGGMFFGADRADISPVYRLIFSRLRALGFDWRYSYPRLGVVRFEQPQKEGVEYDSSEAFEREQKEAESRRKYEEMKEDLRQGYNESVREARKLPPPETVKAYMSVYGSAPVGWPPKEDDGE